MLLTKLERSSGSWIYALFEEGGKGEGLSPGDVGVFRKIILAGAQVPRGRDLQALKWALWVMAEPRRI